MGTERLMVGFILVLTAGVHRGSTGNAAVLIHLRINPRTVAGGEAAISTLASTRDTNGSVRAED